MPARSSITEAATRRSAEPVRLGGSLLGVELLDDPGAEPGAVRASLGHIARANRWFGGTAAVLWGLERAVAGLPEGTTLTLLDIGTGAGDIPHAAGRWAAQRGYRLRPIGLERSPVAARLAAKRGLPVIIADAGALPLRAGSVDLVLLSQVAHHFAPASAAALFRSARQIARRALVVADLRRSRTAIAAFTLGARAFRFDPVTIADGLTSIRRGYTRSELSGLLPGAIVARRPGWRLAAVWPAE
jgi:SAM-dependent methyltransferase